MATKEVTIHSIGPFPYDDTLFYALKTDGQQYVGGAPTIDQHVVRKMDVLDLAWPVGSVFISVVSTNPNTLLGGGTWVAFGTGRVLVGIDSADADFDTVEETGGAKTVAAVGTVSQPTFTGSELATHIHNADGTLATDTSATHTHDAGTYNSGTPSASDGMTAGGTGVASLGHTHQVVSGVSGSAGNHSHDVTGNTSATSGGTPSGTVSQPTFTGTPTSVVQPYIAVYMWKRTA